MDVLLYNDFEYHKLKEKITKVIGFLKAGDFRAADVKKMSNQGYYRAKLDDTNRLLFCIGQYNGRKYLFILETILNHNYARSRFLNGVAVDENKLQAVDHEEETSGHEIAISYVNAGKKSFNILDKVLSFDDIQQDIVHLPAPIIVIGPAGSGKTALMLEKLKALQGNILYTSLSSYLVENAQNLYSSFGYDNARQEVEFLSFSDYLSSFQASQGKEVSFRSFQFWVDRYKQGYKIKDSHKLFEEFKGVLTGSAVDKPFLSAEDYEQLGIRQSIFPKQDRAAVYQLFTKYLAWLGEEGYYDSNILSYTLLEKIRPRYDYVVVDEVQDITNVQLSAILKSLHRPEHFLLCGDSNQIVHPNFFSWSQVKTLFYQQELKANIIRVLATNYRNTPEVTGLANRLLLIKNARFGSIDKESTYLVKSSSSNSGVVEFLPNSSKVNKDLDQKTSKSTKFAVLVLREEDKAEARKHFRTPLLFSIQEAKGLEYESIILFNMISSYDKTFREIVAGVSEKDLEEESLQFSRAKDKTDRSLDEYKFYVNALYVGMTRAIKNLFLIESSHKHDLLRLLGLVDLKAQSSLKQQQSSAEEWQEEARKLELQGKQEQAEAIRKEILHIKEVGWDVVTFDKYPALLRDALNPESYNKKAKDRLFSYAAFYELKDVLEQLVALKYRPAERWEQERKSLVRRLFQPYMTDNLQALQPTLQQYGLDFKYEYNVTPLMMAVQFGSHKILHYLFSKQAKITPVDNFGSNALQHAIRIARKDVAYKRTVFSTGCSYLKHSSLRLRIDNRLVKMENHQAEYLIVNFMLANFRSQIVEGTASKNRVFRDAKSPTFQAQDLLDFYDGLGEQVVPEYRTRRAYVSSILAKNELDRDDKYNKKLFLRLKTGHYILSPMIDVQIDEQWVNIYQLIGVQEIAQGEFLMNTMIFRALSEYGVIEYTGW